VTISPLYTLTLAPCFDMDTRYCSCIPYERTWERIDEWEQAAARGAGEVCEGMCVRGMRWLIGGLLLVVGFVARSASCCPVSASELVAVLSVLQS
jgi:hypothetical protein